MFWGAKKKLKKCFWKYFSNRIRMWHKMTFIIFFLFCLKTFEKVEKTGIISSKFSLRCTPSVILGLFKDNLKSTYEKYQNKQTWIWLLIGVSKKIQTFECSTWNLILKRFANVLSATKWMQRKFQSFMGRFIYILDSLNYSSFKFWSSQFASSSRSNRIGIWTRHSNGT